MEKMKLYPKGFIFSEEDISRVPKQYQKLIIQDTYKYWFDEDETPHTYEKNDTFIIIHGEYVHIGLDNQYTEEGLLRYLLDYFISDYDEYLDILDHIAGRYVIIIGNKEEVYVYPDAANTRTLYFSTKHNSIASHVYLLKDQYECEKEQFLTELPNMANGLLKTPFTEIKSILPNHMLSVKTKEISRFYPRENNKYKIMEEEEKFNLIERYLDEQLKFFFNKFDNIITSITGGGDSRFVLAILKDYIEEVEFFTYSTKSVADNSTYEGQILTYDLIIVRQILEYIKLNHKFIYFKENKIELSDKIRNLISKNSIGPASSFLVPQTMEHFPKKDLFHLRGNLLEIGQARLYRSRYRESNIEEVKIEFMKRYGNSKNQVANNYAENSFNDFVENIGFNEKTYDFHLLDLYYWEIRGGRWYSEVINTHDIVFETISPFNHRALIELSLSFSYEKRRDEYMFTEVINRKFPILNFFGDNNLLNLYEQNRDKKYN